MHVGVLQIELLIPWSESLKDKRRVTRSLKDRLHREHQVSVAEVGALEHHTVAVLAVACVATTPQRCAEVLEACHRKAAGLHDAELAETARAVLPWDALSARAHADDRLPHDVDAEMLDLAGAMDPPPDAPSEGAP
jgi:uncharacterized protein YlxP (DUF503 family)